jgi:Skp family chaperone for outer membrane proteins
MKKILLATALSLGLFATSQAQQAKPVDTKIVKKVELAIEKVKAKCTVDAGTLSNISKAFTSMEETLDNMKKGMTNAAEIANVQDQIVNRKKVLLQSFLGAEQYNKLTEQEVAAIIN